MQRLVRKILKSANWQELNLEASYWSYCFEDQQNSRGHPKEKKKHFFDDVGSVKINVLIIIGNFISYVFINWLPGYFFLAQKNVETILRPFSIQWGGDHAVLLKINIQWTFEY